MNKKVTEPQDQEWRITSGKVVELRLFVPKEVKSKLEKLAKKSRMSIPALLEEMVDTHAHGIDL